MIAPELPMSGESFGLIGEKIVEEPPCAVCIACKERATVNLRGHCETCAREIASLAPDRDQLQLF